MKILAIETSCDETAIAIIEASGNPRKNDVHFNALSNIILSQVTLHAQYGGVYPALAKREHAKNLIPAFKQALRESGFLNEKQKTKNKKGELHSTFYILHSIFEREPELLKQFIELIPIIKKPDIGAIAVTHGPGLEPALWVGINFARALSLVWNIPVIPVNHMEGHIFSALLKKNATTYNLQPIAFPALALLISGGHTELVLIKNWLEYKLAGETGDDAAGEAFDKVARMLGLPYPGGPHISNEAEKFTGEKKLILPRPKINSGDCHFSFSGLKTAVLYKLKEIKKLTPKIIQEFSHEFQEAVADVLVSKTIKAAKEHGVKTIIVGGGVSANKRIRERLAYEISKKLPGETTVFFPPRELTTDNALMIAVAGYIRTVLKKYAKKDIIARGNLRLS